MQFVYLGMNVDTKYISWLLKFFRYTWIYDALMTMIAFSNVVLLLPSIDVNILKYLLPTVPIFFFGLSVHSAPHLLLFRASHSMIWSILILVPRFHCSWNWLFLSIFMDKLDFLFLQDLWFTINGLNSELIPSKSNCM